MSARAHTAACAFETVTALRVLLKLKEGEGKVESVLGAECSYFKLPAPYCLLPSAYWIYFTNL